MLMELLDRLLSAYDEMKPHMNPRDLIKESQKIHSVCMFEVVRQVSVGCVERGVLLKRIWEWVFAWAACCDCVPPQCSCVVGVSAGAQGLRRVVRISVACHPGNGGRHPHAL